MFLSCVSDKDSSVLASDFCFNLSGHLDSWGRLGIVSLSWADFCCKALGVRLAVDGEPNADARTTGSYRLARDR